MRFVIGFVSGLLVLGAYVGHQELQERKDPCLAHCGVGTECVEGVCLIPQPVSRTKKKRERRRRRRGRWRRRRADTTGNTDPALKKPTAADSKARTHGPSLRQTDYVDLSSSKNASGRELSSSEIDARVRREEIRIVACIDWSRGDLDINSGKVVVRFRIERSGRVRKVQLTAPSALIKRGLHGCVRPLITSLRFGSTSRSLIMTYPYSLK